VCKSVLDGSDIKCLPFDIFRTGTLNEDLLNYLVTPGFQIGTTQEWIVNGSLNGDIGVTIPWAQSPISAAVGAEYRQEKLQHRVDLAFSTGDLAGQGGPTPSVDGSFDVTEAFGEIVVPLVEDKPFVKLLELNGGYRISDYENAGITHTYKYGASYMPVEDVRFRGTFQRAVRAPNIVELFTPSYFGLWGGQDPCAATTSSGIVYSPAFTSAQCLNLQLSLAQVAAFAASGNFSCPSAQCSALYRGNESLKPEESDTKSFGLVFTPTFLKGFTASVDYFDIFVDGAIGIIPQSVLLETCAATPADPICTRIHRDPSSGQLFGAGYIDSPNENLGSVKTTGIDVEANYRIDLDMIDLADTLTLNLVGSYVDSLEITPLPGATSYDCKGLFGTTCGNPTPEWRHKFRATWASPWDVSLTFAWRYISEVKLDSNPDDPSDPNFNAPDAEIPSYDYFDLAFDWSLTDKIMVTGGINNLTDEDPKALDSNNIGVSSPPFGNGNTFPVVYDSLGREVFIGMTTKF
jgi:outer membrane receptor protein involved in Fe transport